MDGGEMEIPEPNTNPFGMSLGFNSPSPMGLGRRTRISWRSEFGVGGGKNCPRPASLLCLLNNVLSRFEMIYPSE